MKLRNSNARIRREATPEISQRPSGPASVSALTRLEVILIIAVVALLGIVSVPIIGKAREKAQRADCQCRLKQLGIGFRTWEGDFSNRYTMSVPVNQGGSMEWQAGTNTYRHFLTMADQLGSVSLLTCPSDERKPAKDWASLRNTNLSYFVGLDADETMPAMVLSGDRNLETNNIPVKPGLVVIAKGEAVGWCRKMHHFAGNVLLADASVQQCNSNSLSQLLSNAGAHPIHLAVP